MWPFDSQKTPDMLPDIQRKPVDGWFTPVLADYEARRGTEKVGLCLGGGGAKGAWQAGFLARMEEVGALKFVDIIAGTSVGGLNSLILGRYWSGNGPGRALANVWRGIRGNSDIYNGTVPDGFLSGAWALIRGKLNGPSFLDVSPLEAMCKKHLLGYSKFPIPVYVMTTSYQSKQKVVMGPGTQADFMARATSAVPVMFPAYAGDYMDGACRDNVPFDFLLENGVTKLVVLYCDPDASKVGFSSAKATSLTTGTAAIEALYNVQEEVAYRELENMGKIRELSGLDPIEVAHFYPSQPTGSLLQFTESGRLLQQGYDDACTYLTPDKVKAFLKS